MAKASTQKDLYTKYKEEIVPTLKKELNIKNELALPRLSKISINIGIGSYTKKLGNKDFSHIIENLALISGQKPVVKHAKKAVSNFKTRVGDPVGINVTIRGKRMYDFLDKLINIVFPRTRDFRGVSHKSFDGQGNFAIGFKEHIAFPEISPDDIMNLHGLQINIITTAKDDDSGYKLLKEFGFPFRKK